MTVRFGDYKPCKVDKVYTFTFFLLPELSVFYLNGFRSINFAWLFWDIMIDLRKEGEK